MTPTHSVTVTASTAEKPVNITAEKQAPPVVASSTRTISGRVLPWNEIGRTSAGALEFPKGSINVPREISRVKLLAGHSPSGEPVGHATGFESREDGLYMTFQLGSSDAATASLASASEKVIDAFSIEAYGIEKTGTRVTKSILSAVALVPLPAFANARADLVNASAPNGSGQDDSTDEEQEQTDPPTDPDTDEDQDDSTEEEQEQEMNRKTLTPGTLPGEFGGATQTTEAHASLTDVVNYLAGANMGRADDSLIAELTDITDAGMIGRSAPQWLGELWNGVTYQREIIPLMTQANLTSRKAVGYRWTKKPGVDKYAGNKTEIPSKDAAIEAVERDAQRWAGGNDLDRAFWDFNETEFLAAYWRAMAESYAYETDRDAAQFLVANASTVGGVADNLIHAAARGSISIKNDLKQAAGFVLINPNDFESILQLSALDAPKFLDIIPAMNPANWKTSEFVTAGTVLVGTKAAATHYELSGSPLRVEAEHIAKGGRDAALFGYTANMLNRPEGLQLVTFDAASTPVVEG